MKSHDFLFNAYVPIDRSHRPLRLNASLINDKGYFYYIRAIDCIVLLMNKINSLFPNMKFFVALFALIAVAQAKSLFSEEELNNEFFKFKVTIGAITCYNSK